MKSEWWDRRLRIVNTDSLQIGLFDVTKGADMANIGSLTSNGMELETAVMPFRGVSLGFNMGYNHVTYSDARRNMSPKLNTALFAQYEARTRR